MFKMQLQSGISILSNQNPLFLQLAPSEIFEYEGVVLDHVQLYIFFFAAD